MNAPLSYHGNHPQRKKLFPINDRHNLNTNVELHWLSSLPNSSPISRKQIKREDVSSGTNNSENRKLLGRYAIDEFETRDPYRNYSENNRISKLFSFLQIPNAREKETPKSYSLERNKIGKTEEILNEEVKQFQESKLLNQKMGLKQGRPRQGQKGFSSYAQYLRQFNLRSAFDSPSFIQSISQKDHKLFRQRVPDNLESHLRRNFA